MRVTTYKARNDSYDIGDLACCYDSGRPLQLDGAIRACLVQVDSESSFRKHGNFQGIVCRRIFFLSQAVEYLKRASIFGF